MLERPDVFQRLAALDDAALDRVVAGMEAQPTAGKARPRKLA